MERWLITGGCGFIGCNLVRHLRATGDCAIRVLDHLEVGRRARLQACGPVVEIVAGAAPSPGAAIELVVADILDADAVRAATAGCEVVVHLAANTDIAHSVAGPRHGCLVNVIGTLNCLEAARAAGVRRFVFASSAASLGEVAPPAHEEVAPHPVSPYGASKLSGEGYCAAYFKSFGLEAVALRLGNVYGLDSDRQRSVVAAFIRRALAGAPLEIYGDGTQTRDFIFADDPVRAIRRAAMVPGVGGEVFHIATGRETSVTELAELVAATLARHGRGAVEIRHAAPRAGDVRRSFADPSKAAALLDWRAEVALADGVARVVEWFLQNAREERAGT